MSEYGHIFKRADMADNNWEKGVNDCIDILNYRTTRGTSAEMKAAKKFLSEIKAMKEENARRKGEREDQMDRLFTNTKYL